MSERGRCPIVTKRSSHLRHQAEKQFEYKRPNLCFLIMFELKLWIEVYFFRNCNEREISRFLSKNLFFEKNAASPAVGGAADFFLFQTVPMTFYLSEVLYWKLAVLLAKLTLTLRWDRTYDKLDHCCLMYPGRRLYRLHILISSELQYIVIVTNKIIWVIWSLGLVRVLGSHKWKKKKTEKSNTQRDSNTRPFISHAGRLAHSIMKAIMPDYG